MIIACSLITMPACWEARGGTLRGHVAGTDCGGRLRGQFAETGYGGMLWGHVGGMLRGHVVGACCGACCGGMLRGQFSLCAISKQVCCRDNSGNSAGLKFEI